MNLQLSRTVWIGLGLALTACANDGAFLTRAWEALKQDPGSPATEPREPPPAAAEPVDDAQPVKGSDKDGKSDVTRSEDRK